MEQILLFLRSSEIIFNFLHCRPFYTVYKTDPKNWADRKWFVACDHSEFSPLKHMRSCTLQRSILRGGKNVFAVSPCQKIYISDRKDSNRHRLTNIWLTQPLPACSVRRTAEPVFSVKTWMFLTAKKGLISWSFDLNLGRYCMYKKMFKVLFY